MFFWNSGNNKGLFDGRFLVMLFKCSENRCELKSVVEIRIMMFKHYK